MKRMQKVVIGVLALAGFSGWVMSVLPRQTQNQINAPARPLNSERMVNRGVIEDDVNFDKLPSFLESFNSCVKDMSRPLVECDAFFTVDDTTFFGREKLSAALPQVRQAFQELVSVEFQKPTGKSLISDANKNVQVLVYDVRGTLHYKHSTSAVTYTVVVQNGELKLNSYVVANGPN